MNERRPPIPRVTRMSHFARALLACCGLAAVAAAASAQGLERQYRLQFLNSQEGIAIATNFCPDEKCSVAPGPPGFIRVRGDAVTQEKIAKALAAADLPPADQAFQLILLEADRTGSGDPGPLPPAARKALADLKDFLPYSGFRLLDSAFVRTTREARVVVEGMGGRAYEATLVFRGDPRASGAELLLERFSLRVIPSDPIGLLLGVPGAAPVAREQARGGGHPPPPAGAGPGAPPPPAMAPGAEPPAAPGSPPGSPTPTPPPSLSESLLSTSFSIHRGETVVVGTSKLDGGRALVVLLTALP